MLPLEPMHKLRRPLKSPVGADTGRRTSELTGGYTEQSANRLYSLEFA